MAHARLIGQCPVCMAGRPIGLSKSGNKEVCMIKVALVAASAVLSLPLIVSGVGVSMAQQVICNPHCSPTYGNSTSDSHRGQGLRHANDVAGEHGFEGRDNARQKQDAHRPGGSGVPDPAPVPVPVPTPTTDPAPAPPPSPSPTPTGLPTCSLC